MNLVCSPVGVKKQVVIPSEIRKELGMVDDSKEYELIWIKTSPNVISVIAEERVSFSSFV